MKRRILITSALPYANADLHLGNMLEHLLTDMWSRFQRMRGHDVLALCADDTHGAPIMVEAKRLGIKPEEHIVPLRKKHEADLKDFLVHYDHYSSTNTDANRKLCYEIYEKISRQSHFVKRSIKQFFCTHDQMFLPDRFVRGTCPKCGALDQYGDNCDKCAAIYTPIELKDPRCTFCGNAPEVRPSEHLFFVLNNFKDFLVEWVPTHTTSAVANKMTEWLGGELQDWCISRDAPYFGFEIPGVPGKFFYVWFDAPIGYIATTAEWCELNGKSLDDYWRNKDVEIYHNIGKDIIYFHSLFWPAMLKAAGFQLPAQVFAHGFLTANGEKLSKSRGTFINARTYLNHLDPEYLRFYFACKLSDGIGDIDLNFDDFALRVNSDLIGKITNLASRSAQMLHKRFEGRLSTVHAAAGSLLTKLRAQGEVIADCYDKRLFAKALLDIRGLADEANKYFDDYAPWILIKTNPAETQEILTATLNVFRVLCIYLKPVLPRYAAKVEVMFSEGPFSWDSVNETRENAPLQPYAHLLSRIEADKIRAIVEDSVVEKNSR